MGHIPMPVVDRVRELVVSALDGLGLELFDLTFRRAGRRQILGVFIDKEGGVTLDDCQRASREISTLLDVKDIVPGSYSLEVSSPGINRLIRNEQEFKKYEGSKIKVRLFTDISNQKTFIGINRGVEKDILRLEISPGQEIHIPVHEIARANVETDF
jgi:ribosome maturation factor RimP